MFYDNLAGLERVLVVAPLAYVWLIAVLRATGKRTLAQLNAFDFIVTVALGSTLATVVLTTSVALAEGVVALLALALLQLVVAWLAVHAGWVRRHVTSRPTLLVQDGAMVQSAMTRERVTAASVHQTLRACGVGGIDLVAAVVLETNGTLSVVTRDKVGNGSALAELTTSAPTEHPHGGLS